METTNASGAGLADRLTAQIDSLQEAFHSLSTVSTLKDLAARFAAIVRGMYAGSDVCLVHRTAGSEAWLDMANSTNRHPADFLPLPGERTGSTGSLNASSNEIRVVLRLVDHSSAGIIVSGPPPGPQLTDADLVSLRLCAQLFDNAYQAMLSRRHEKNLIFSLNHRVLQLNSLIDTGIEVARLNQEVVPEHLALERAASLTNASRGVLTITGTEGQTDTLCFPADAAGNAARESYHRIATAFTFGGKSYAFELFDKESRSGPVPFDETDQLLLDALARQVHASLENRYLHAQALEKQKIEQDLAVAASIQQRILPASLPVIAGYDIAGINIPSKSVGGDYYDCIPLADGRYALIIADVAGKGIPAALLVSSLHAYLSAYIETTMPLPGLAGRLNRVINRASTEDKFITAFFALLTPATGELETLNAGHTTVFLVHADTTVQELNAGGIPLGMLDMDFPYQSEHSVIGAGDRLLLYTDGVTEAFDEHGQLYDSGTKLKEFAVSSRPERAETFISDLIGDIRRFAGRAPQNDDITALYLLRRSTPTA